MDISGRAHEIDPSGEEPTTDSENVPLSAAVEVGSGDINKRNFYNIAP